MECITCHKEIKDFPGNCYVVARLISKDVGEPRPISEVSEVIGYECNPCTFSHLTEEQKTMLEKVLY